MEMRPCQVCGTKYYWFNDETKTCETCQTIIFSKEDAQIVFDWINSAAVEQARRFGPQSSIPALIKLMGLLKDMTYDDAESRLVTVKGSGK